MDRRAALQMSLQSIMVFILAFIVMGILIGVIQSIFDPVREQVAELEVIEIDAGTSFGKEPDRQEPVVIGAQSIQLDPSETKTIDVGFYNLLSGTLVGSSDGSSVLTFSIERCRDFNGDLETNVPQIAGTFEIGANDEVRPGEVRKYSADIREAGLPPNERYACVLQVSYAGELRASDGSSDPNFDGVIGQANFNVRVGED